MPRKIAVALIAVASIAVASGFPTDAYAGCCDAGNGRREGGWVWRPVSWSWDAGLMWRAEGWGAPVWGYSTCYRPRQVLTPWGWSWQVVRVC